MSSYTRSRTFGAARARLWLMAGLLGLAVIAPVLAADWPNWRGPQRNGISSETGWTSNWGAAGPKQLWRAQVGEGYSSMTVAEGRLYTMGAKAGQDTVYCLDAATGKEIWAYSYACKEFRDYSGPRATPTVDGNRVYTLSREAQAYCFDAASGKVIWSLDLRQAIRARVPGRGYAGSPLVHGKLVIYNVGRAGTALDKSSGKLAWQTGPTVGGFASPLPYTLGRQKGVAIFTAGYIVGLNPATGKQYWSHPWPTMYGVNAADPIFVGDKIFLSSSYNMGCTLLQVRNNKTSEVWRNRNMHNHINSSILIGETIYGNDRNTLKAISLKTGEVSWQMRGYGKGGLIAADGKLIVLTDRGELVIVKATPEKYEELARAKVMEGQCWISPVLANGRIYCRNHEGDLICLDVRAK